MHIRDSVKHFPIFVPTLKGFLLFEKCQWFDAVTLPSVGGAAGRCDSEVVLTLGMMHNLPI